MRYLPHLLFVLCAASLMAQNNEVEITAEPAHRQIFANEFVRAFYVEVPPHGQTQLHRHRHDYVAIILGPSQVENDVAGKPPETLKMQDGDTHFVPGGFAHIAKNLADTPFRNVAVEFLQDDKARNAPSPWKEDRGVDILEGGTAETLFVKDGARVTEVELRPGGVIPKHHHNGPHLLVAVSDLDLLSQRIGPAASAPQKTQLKAGEVLWVPGNVTHTVTNAAPAPAKLVTIEFP